MVEQWNIDGGTVEQRWWTSGKIMLEHLNRYGGTVEQLWWTSGTVMVEQWNSETVIMKQRNSCG